MKKQAPVVEIKTCLKKQTEIVDQIYDLQKAIYNSVMEREWMESEKALQKVKDLSTQFMDLDKNLYEMMKAQNPKHIDFFEYTKSFPEEEKNELNDLYKSLQKKLLESKIENDSLSNYVTHAQSLVQGMVDIITEDRNGKCYTPNGQRVSVDLSNIVLDKSF